MLTYFPQIYPDELLYSVLARYHRHTGSTSPKQTLDDLFGDRRVIARHDLPGHLELLVQRIPASRDLSRVRVLMELTLYPYFLAFADEVRRGYARLAMEARGTSGLYLKLGLAASRVPVANVLRFCPECLLQMGGDYGELYWRRSHQLPGVLVCVDHAVPLRESSVSLSRENRHAFIAAIPENCRNSEPCWGGDTTSDRDHLHDLARRSVRLLSEVPPARTPVEWSRIYQEKLADRGFLRGNHKIDQSKLALRCHECFSDELFRRITGIRSGSALDTWLMAFGRKLRSSLHPLCHLLMQQLLEFLPAIERPFGKGPWPCLNPLESHCGQLLISEASIHRNRGRTIGVFRCDCGYRYCRHLSEEGLPSESHRPLDYGRAFDAALHAATASGVSLRSIARQLHVDPNTIRRQSRRLGLQTVWQLLGAVRSPSKKPSLQRRPKRCVEAGASKKDWPSLDAEWVNRIRTGTETIMAMDPPQRVTLTRLEGLEGKRGCLGKKLHRLPYTAELIRQVVESVEAFQWRRVKWAIARLQEQGIAPMPWRVQKLAGLRRLPPVLPDSEDEELLGLLAGRTCKD